LHQEQVVDSKSYIIPTLFSIQRNKFTTKRRSIRASILSLGMNKDDGNP
jgi:ABC-type phosphate transport system permease subunit